MSNELKTGWLRLPRGLFVVFEGIEACGKSTQVARVAEDLVANGYEVVTVHEPGGTDYGQEARELFLKHHRTMTPESEIGLLLTAKKQLLEQVIKPAMARGAIVLCDRYTDTLFTYQHHAKGHSAALIRRMIDVFQADLQPDLVVHCKVSAPTSCHRIEMRRSQGGDYNSMDSMARDFHYKLEAGMAKQMARHVDERRITVDTEVLDIAGCTSAILSSIHTYIYKNWHGLHEQALSLESERS